jgi:hypothetical protein
MSQIDMFGDGLPRPDEATIGKFQRDAHQTSVAAAIALAPKSGTQRRIVLDFIGRAGERGLTDRELQHYTRIRRARTRRKELVDLGWVVYSGRKRLLPDTKNRAEIWVLSEEARRQWRDDGSQPSRGTGVEGD